MKKFLVLMLIMIVSLVGCKKKAGDAQSLSNNKKKITIFVAASLTEPIQAIKKNYEKKNNVEIICNFDSSGTLRTQLIAGADCDIFISAAKKQMDDITVNKNKKNVDISDPATIFNYLENNVVLAISPKSKAKVSSFDDLMNKLKKKDNIMLAIGNSDVPVGAYTLKIFNYYGIKESDIQKNISYGSNVKEVTSQISNEAVDCGIVYQTDAFSAGLKVVDKASEEMCGQVIYPACIIRKSSKNKEVIKFFDYLKSEEAMSEMERVGFVSAF